MREYEYVLELYHHGIKDMRWGVRRYQNQDGSLTAAGRVRYGVSKVGKAVGSAASKISNKASESYKNKKELRRINKLKKKPVSKLNDAEIEERYERLAKEKKLLDMERQVSSLKPSLASGGKKFLSKLGTDVLLPATLNAGKEVLERWLKKHGYDIAGLKDTQYGISALERAANKIKTERDMLENKKKIAQDRDYLDKREEAAAKAEKEAREAKKKAKTQSKVDKEIEKNIRKAEKEAEKSNRQAEKEAERKRKEEKKVYSGEVQGEPRKAESPKKEKPADYYDPIEVSFIDRDEPVSNVRTSNAYQIGSTFVERLLLTD